MPLPRGRRSQPAATVSADQSPLLQLTIGAFAPAANGSFRPFVPRGLRPRQIELRNPSLALGAAELHDHIDGFPDVFAHFGEGQRCASLQHHDRKPVDGEFCGFSVDCRDRPAMAGVDGFEIGQGLGPAQFANDDPVGSHSEGGLEKGVGATLRAGTAVGQEGDGVGLTGEELEGVFDGDQPFAFADMSQKVAGESGFAGRGPTADQDVEPPLDQGLQRGFEVLICQTGDVLHFLGAERVQRHGLAEEIGRGVVPDAARGEETDGDRGTAIDGGRYGDLDPKRTACIFYLAGDEGVLFRNAGLGIADDGLGHVEGCGPIHGLTFVAHGGVACDLKPDLAVRVDRDLDHVIASQEVAERVEIALEI